jgi:hypothetical protein
VSRSNKCVFLALQLRWMWMTMILIFLDIWNVMLVNMGECDVHIPYDQQVSWQNNFGFSCLSTLPDKLWPGFHFAFGRALVKFYSEQFNVDISIHCRTWPMQLPTVYLRMNKNSRKFYAFVYIQLLIVYSVCCDFIILSFLLFFELISIVSLDNYTCGYKNSA